MTKRSSPVTTPQVEETVLDERRGFLLDFFREAAIVQSLGMELAYEEGRAIVTLPPNPALHHPLKQLHGGMIGTILDSSAWFDAAPFYGVWISTTDYQVRLLEPVAEDVEVRAVAEPVRLGQRTAVETVRVVRGDGSLVAVGTATMVTTSEELPLLDRGESRARGLRGG